MSDEKVLAVITARSGSKSLPDKNILPLCGRPLMAHTIRAAIESGVFEDVVVSTDSERYAAIAREYGANVPFLRSAKNSGDTAGSWPVVREVVERLENGERYGSVMLLQPTSPLRTANHIREAVALYHKKNAKAVISVCECEYSPLLCNTLGADLSLEGFIPPQNLLRRQDMPVYYMLNGAIYMVSLDFLRKSESFNPYQDGSYAYIMPKEASVDIDSAIDLEYAGVLFNHVGVENI